MVDVLFLFIALSGDKDSQEEVGGGRPLEGATGLLRVLRVVRIVRLLRILKLGDLGKQLMKFFKSDASVLLARLAFFILLILAVNHYIACFWYAIGVSNAEDDMTWVRAQNLEGMTVEYPYVMSLHWALTQFSPSTNDIVAVNGRERTFAIFVVLFALVAFSSFVSSVTDAVNQLRTINMDYVQQEAEIRSFILTRQLSTNLGASLQHFFKSITRSSSGASTSRTSRSSRRCPRAS